MCKIKFSAAGNIVRLFASFCRVPAPTAGVASIVPGKPRPGKASLTSLSSYLGIYHINE